MDGRKSGKQEDEESAENRHLTRPFRFGSSPSSLMRKVPNPCLALFTERTALRPNVTLAQAVAPAVTGGVNLVVLREDDLPPNHRLTVAQFVRDGVRGRALY